MRIQLLPSTFDEKGCTSARQHLACFVIDDCLAIDAGSLAMAVNSKQREQIRDIVLTHAHLDHIAGLPLFIDDLFETLTEPIRIHASHKVIKILQKNIFNWKIYPDFAELTNKKSPVLEYCPFEIGSRFSIKHLEMRAIKVNHKVPTVGFLVSDGKSSIAMSGDTSKMSGFWDEINSEKNIKAVLIDCAFPNELKGLAKISHHFTPKALKKEMRKVEIDCPVFAVNLKPMYRNEIIKQLDDLAIKNLQILEVGKVYEW